MLCVMAITFESRVLSVQMGEVQTSWHTDYNLSQRGHDGRCFNIFDSCHRCHSTIDHSFLQAPLSDLRKYAPETVSKHYWLQINIDSGYWTNVHIVGGVIFDMCVETIAQCNRT